MPLFLQCGISLSRPIAFQMRWIMARIEQNRIKLLRHGADNASEVAAIIHGCKECAAGADNGRRARNTSTSRHFQPGAKGQGIERVVFDFAAPDFVRALLRKARLDRARNRRRQRRHQRYLPTNSMDINRASPSLTLNLIRAAHIVDLQAPYSREAATFRTGSSGRSGWKSLSRSNTARLRAPR